MLGIHRDLPFKQGDGGGRIVDDTVFIVRQTKCVMSLRMLRCQGDDTPDLIANLTETEGAEDPVADLQACARQGPL